MEPDLSQLVVMRMDADPPTQHSTEVAGGHGELMVLRIDDRLAWARGENVLIIAGEPGKRMFLQAAYVAPSGKFHLLRKSRTWRPFDARRDERYATHFQARARVEGAAWRATGTVVDISAGGVAIELAAEPPSSHLTVDILAGGYRAELEIEVLSRSDTAAGAVLHCRFEAMTPARTAFVRSVIADLEDQATANAA
jgi:hypothetical protein